MGREHPELPDLRVFTMMDWSEGSEVEGKTDMTQSVVDTSFEATPNATGFVEAMVRSFPSPHTTAEEPVFPRVPRSLSAPTRMWHCPQDRSPYKSSACQDL